MVWASDPEVPQPRIAADLHPGRRQADREGHAPGRHRPAPGPRGEKLTGPAKEAWRLMGVDSSATSSGLSRVLTMMWRTTTGVGEQPVNSPGPRLRGRISTRLVLICVIAGP